MEKAKTREHITIIEGRNAVSEAVKSGRQIEKLVVLDGSSDRALKALLREAGKRPGVKVEYAGKRTMDLLSETGRHQGIIAYIASYDYAGIDELLKKAEKKGEPPFLFVLDGIEDPHNLGAIIRTANQCGAHGVIIREARACPLTAAVAKASAGAINYTPVARVTNIARTIEQLKERGLWFVCADMGGETMYKLNLTGPLGIVIGNEGSGVSELVKKRCDMAASIPMYGDVDSLNASVAAGVLAYEAVRQRKGFL